VTQGTKTKSNDGLFMYLDVPSPLTWHLRMPRHRRRATMPPPVSPRPGFADAFPNLTQWWLWIKTQWQLPKKMSFQRAVSSFKCLLFEFQNPITWHHLTRDPHLSENLRGWYQPLPHGRWRTCYVPIISNTDPMESDFGARKSTQKNLRTDQNSKKCLQKNNLSMGFEDPQSH